MFMTFTIELHTQDAGPSKHVRNVYFVNTLWAFSALSMKYLFQKSLNGVVAHFIKYTNFLRMIDYQSFILTFKFEPGNKC